MERSEEHFFIDLLALFTFCTSSEAEKTNVSCYSPKSTCMHQIGWRDSECQQLLYTAAKIYARLSSYSCVDSKCFMLLSFCSRTSDASPLVSLEIRRRCSSSSDGRIASHIAVLLIDWLVANRHFNIDIAMGSSARGCAAVALNDDIIPEMIAHQALLFGGLHTGIMDPTVGFLFFYTHR